MGKVLPILFNTEMVRAILDDRKTTTRRIIKPSYRQDESGFKAFVNMGTKERWVEKIDEEEMSFDPPRYVIPPFQPGDILYVRETWSTRQSNACMGNTTTGCPYDNCENAPGPCFEDEYIYKATDSLDSSIRKWRPSIHMPKAAARLWLKVTDVQPQRLKDMTLDDFRKEGIIPMPEAFDDPENAYMQARKAFIQLWDSTIPKRQQDIYSWAVNPWVWVTEFKQCEKPESET